MAGGIDDLEYSLAIEHGMGVGTYQLAEGFAQQVCHFARRHLVTCHGGLSVDDVVFVCSKDVQSIVLRCGATDAGSYLVSDDHSQTEYVFDDGTLMVVSGNTCTVGRTLDVAQIVGVGERRGCL